MKKILQKKEGQSLVEVIVAMSIMMLTASAIMMLTVNVKNLTYSAQDTTKATALAQDGIEIIRSNRNIGCNFANLVADTATSCHAIKSDTVGSGDPDNGSNQVIPITGVACAEAGNRIDNFSGFNRVVYLYELSVVGPSWADDPGNAFDNIDKYYYAKVVVSWKDSTGPKSTEISTIMLKK